jgi:hypothetical protein
MAKKKKEKQVKKKFKRELLEKVVKEMNDETIMGLDPEIDPDGMDDDELLTAILENSMEDGEAQVYTTDPFSKEVVKFFKDAGIEMITPPLDEEDYSSEEDDVDEDDELANEIDEEEVEEEEQEEEPEEEEEPEPEPEPKKKKSKKKKPVEVEEEEEEAVEEEEKPKPKKKGKKVKIDPLKEEVVEEEEAPKKKGKKAAAEKPAKDKTKRGKVATPFKGPGVIKTIRDFIVENGPVTKEEILEHLTETFPDRDPKAMTGTMNVQVPNRINKECDFQIEKNEDGGWFVAGSVLKKGKKKAVKESTAKEMIAEKKKAKSKGKKKSKK